jgi:hydroxymethylpyrimidine/phosphomethylpyrimidine kinase
VLFSEKDFMDHYHLSRTVAIAGFDHSGKSGLQHDLNVFSALGSTEMSVLTSLTLPHNGSSYPIPYSCIEEQLKAIVDNVGIDVIKAGVLDRAPVVQAIVNHLKLHPYCKLVLEPSISERSPSFETFELIKRQLFPLTTVLVINIKTASHLLHREIETRNQIETAAFDLALMGPKAVVLRELPEGCFCTSLPMPEVQWVMTPRTGVRMRSGGAFSAAIAAYLSKGVGLGEAIKQAHSFIS